jgi:hypothetical protein
MTRETGFIVWLPFRIAHWALREASLSTEADFWRRYAKSVSALDAQQAIPLVNDPAIA